MKKFTINEYTDYLNSDLAEGVEKVDRLTVAGGINFLVQMGVIKKTGETRPAAGGRGKPSDVFEIPQAWEIEFWSDETAEKVETVVDKPQVLS